MTAPVTAQELVNGVVSVASLPSIYFRLVQVTQDPHSSAHDFAAILADDPGLTGRLLSIVNSAQFGQAGKVDTVSRAIAILGTQQLCEIVLGASVIKLFNKIPKDLVDMDSFWRHSLACALFSKAIAFYLGETQAERFFVSGLLHDIGRLIIYTKIPELAREAIELSRQQNQLLYVTEQEVMGFNHAFLGGLLLEKWNLPVSHQEAVRWHHHPKLATGYMTEASIVHLADIMANALRAGSSGERFVPPLESAAWHHLKMDIRLVPFIIDEVERVFEHVVSRLLGD